MLETIREILKKEKEATNLFKRNIVKEYLQIMVLSYIYKDEESRRLLFYGGSCLRHCYNLPRLSEDLDFIDREGKIDLTGLANSLRKYLKKELMLEIKTKIQKFRILLKFPVLHLLGLSKKGETDLLFLKIEIYPEFGFCKNYKVEIIPIFKFGTSILVKTLDLPALMATKIRAIFFRRWEKRDSKGKVLATVKGRDYFDLVWYLERKIEPNIGCIEGIKSKSQIKSKLINMVKEVDTRSIEYDLLPLIREEDFVKNLAKNYKNIVLNLIEKSFT